MTETGTTSRRDRIRQLTQDEIKTIAMRQIAEGGPQQVSMNAIAKEMGMSGPALYRYFENRHALLLEVVADGFSSLHEALIFADSMETTPLDRVVVMGRAYRTWANENPAVYDLVTGTDTPGMKEESLALCMASRDAVMPLVLAVADYANVGYTPDPSYEVDVAEPYADIPEDFHYIVMRIWSRLHGLVMLELHGQLASAGIDIDRIYDLEFDDTLRLVDEYRDSRAKS